MCSQVVEMGIQQKETEENVFIASSELYRYMVRQASIRGRSISAKA
jgi:hypothetical protein